MSVDAGTVYSEVRVKLGQLGKDIQSASTAFDNLGSEFVTSAEKYSNLAGQKYTNSLKQISKGVSQVNKATASGVYTQSEQIKKLIELRKNELQVLQSRAVKEKEVSNTTIAAINKTRAAISSLEKAELKLDKASKSNKGSMSGFVSSFKLGIAAAAAATLYKVAGYLVDSQAAARDAQETFSKFDVVFSEIKDDAETSAKAFSNSFDLASVTAKKFLSDSGDLLTGLGATQREALSLSVEVNSLAGDLASFTNVQGGATTAAHALLSAMLGEREQAKQLGIVIREEDVQAELLKTGQDKLTGSSLTLAKAKITLKLATEQSKNALGDYARTQDSVANSQKRAEEASKKLKIAIGTGLNPVAKTAADVFTTIANKISEVIEAANNQREAEKAVKEGNATYEQRIDVITKEIEKQHQLSSMIEATAGIEDKAGRERMRSLENERAMLVKAAGYSKKHTEDQKKAAEAAAEAALKERLKREELDAYLKEVDEAFVQTEEGKIQKLKEEIAKWEEYARTANVTAPKVKSVLDSLKDELESLLEKQNELTDDEKKELEYLQAHGKLRKEEVSLVVAANDELSSQSVEYNNKLRELNQTRFEALELEYQQRLSLIETSKADQVYKDAAIKSLNDYYDELRKREAWDTFIENSETTLSYVSSIINSITSIVGSNVSKQLDALESWYSSQQELIEYDGKTKKEYLEQQLADAIEANDEETADDYQKQLDQLALDEEYNKKKAQLQYEADMAEWGAKQLTLAGDTAIAIGKAIASAPWPYNLPSIAWNTASMGLQEASLLASQPVLQAATGGIVLPRTGTTTGTLVNTAENGYPELLLNNGPQGQEMLMSFAEALISKMNTTNIPIMLTSYMVIDGKEIAKSVTRYQRNGNV